METGTLSQAGKIGEQTKGRLQKDRRWTEDVSETRGDRLIYLGEGGGARGHQNLTHTVVETLH